ncbi:pyruvate, phosphate dikinase [Candidatus Nitrosopelagicus brevis]|uniref:pyruvate, phosphate dikinase n=1 Tax=Candidatus Nitrosopelagicus brevis TaxID=1410606 RepID=A0A0A7V1D0_9ARCH|nr:pyruvate, phosphate dikinase [Candidatus Nitrosopelagicus brevis]AJA91991.1 pyruvate, phosphate dikinase [Candidatus Nitrosopelagicus brevis]PTL87899.1 pyruvate, phosphate dikinase [Candidatus Nitrosopelagicus brevis]
MVKNKPVYAFEEADSKKRMLLGGKGAGLSEMTRLKLPVPPGFTITTEVCNKYYENGRKLPKDVMPAVMKNILKMEKKTGKKWNSTKNPLLVSVRSGAAISMPGMMDTILNLGLNEKTVEGFAVQTKNPRFSWDSYRRFIQLFGKVVFGVNDEKFDHVLDSAKSKQGVTDDSKLNVESLKKIVKEYKKICENHTKRKFPDTPNEQLGLAIEAVFRSWMGERAVVYREKNGITKDIANGTAVNVVTMVFGNMGDDSATGVVFTRNGHNGKREIEGEYLTNAQGEDVVAGVRTGKNVELLKKEMPKSHKELSNACEKLEKHFREPQDIEFTIEQGKFYLLQTRTAKMSAGALVKTSVDMVKEKLIDKNRSLTRIPAQQLEALLHRTMDESKVKDHKQLAKGIAASPGAASGIAIFDVKKAIELGEAGKKVILIRKETKPEDVPAFFSAEGILTSLGGKSSHAAIVSRGMGKPCIVGCAELKINYENNTCTANGITVKENEMVSIDGSVGTVFIGEVPTVEPKVTKDFQTILSWAQNTKQLGIRANADTPDAAKLARQYGAQGIGLCRTERMFNESDRIGLFVEMIMAESQEERNKVLKKLQELQKSDFIGILKAMEGYKVTIRLLDPPLHEFLPNPEELKDRMNKENDKSKKTQRVLDRARELAEINPMMGHRGVRVAITYPEIYKMQITAVFEAAAELTKKKVNAKPQIMIPQVGSLAELNYIKSIYDDVKKEIEQKYKKKFKINFGTMLEVVRACLTSDELADTAEFFSFGTNDLTQAVFSFSREDAEGKFLPEYMEKELLETSPFQSIDVNGVGHLMKIGIRQGRDIKKDLEIGICGEHGGDPNSIKFCHSANVSYVSASPHRIPIAIVAAAQAAIEQKKTKKSKK